MSLIAAAIAVLFLQDKPAVQAARPQRTEAEATLIARGWRTGVIAEVEMTMDNPGVLEDEASGRDGCL